MPNYRRWYVPGGTYFFTDVCFGRAPLFSNPAAGTLLRDSIQHCINRRPFEMSAIVLCLRSEGLAVFDIQALGRARRISSRLGMRTKRQIGNRRYRCDLRHLNHHTPPRTLGKPVTHEPTFLPTTRPFLIWVCRTYFIFASPWLVPKPLPRPKK